MTTIPQIQIRTQDMVLGMETTPHRFEIRQPRGIQEIEQQRPELSIRQPQGELYIDQTRAKDALGYVQLSVLSDRIASEGRRILLESIARTAEQGDRLAALHQGTRIEDIAVEDSLVETPRSLLGTPGCDNVDITYIAHTPEIDVEIRPPVHRYTVRQPELEFTRGSLTVYVQQYPKVEIIPPPLIDRVI